MATQPVVTFTDPVNDAKRSSARAQFGLTTSNLNWQRGQIDANRANQTTNLAQKFAQMRETLPGGYAAKGLLNSGIYAQGLFNYNQDKANQFRDLGTSFGTQYGNNTFAQRQAGVTQGAQLADANAGTAQARGEWDLAQTERNWQALLAQQLRGVQ